MRLKLPLLFIALFSLSSCMNSLLPDSSEKQKELEGKIETLEGEITDLKSRMATTEIGVDLLEDEVNLGWATIDLGEPGIQHLNDNFYLAKINVEKHLSGIKITGRIINKASVAYESLTFEVRVLGRTKEFFVPKISPENSTGFSVLLPDVPPEDVKGSAFRYVSASVRYF